jgi:hypothetical protein
MSTSTGADRADRSDTFAIEPTSPAVILAHSWWAVALRGYLV